MRESNFSNAAQNKACVTVSATLYDRRAIDCTATLPLINSLNHLAYLTSTSPRIREMVTVDGGLERLIRILRQVPKAPSAAAARAGAGSKELQACWKWSLAFQCVINIGVRGSESVRTRVVEAGMVPITVRVLENYLRAMDMAREERKRDAHQSRSRTERRSVEGQHAEAYARAEGDEARRLSTRRGALRDGAAAALFASMAVGERGAEANAAPALGDGAAPAQQLRYVQPVASPVPASLRQRRSSTRETAPSTDDSYPDLGSGDSSSMPMEVETRPTTPAEGDEVLGAGEASYMRAGSSDRRHEGASATGMPVAVPMPILSDMPSGPMDSDDAESLHVDVSPSTSASSTMPASVESIEGAAQRTAPMSRSGTLTNVSSVEDFAAASGSGSEGADETDPFGDEDDSEMDAAEASSAAAMEEIEERQTPRPIRRALAPLTEAELHTIATPRWHAPTHESIPVQRQETVTPAQVRSSRGTSAITPRNLQQHHEHQQQLQMHAAHQHPHAAQPQQPHHHHHHHHQSAAHAETREQRHERHERQRQQARAAAAQAAAAAAQMDPTVTPEEQRQLEARRAYYQAQLMHQQQRHALAQQQQQRQSQPAPDAAAQQALEAQRQRREQRAMLAGDVPMQTREVETHSPVQHRHRHRAADPEAPLTARPSPRPANVHSHRGSGLLTGRGIAEGEMIYREEEVLLSLQLLAYLSKYGHVRALMHNPELSGRPEPGSVEELTSLFGLRSGPVEPPQVESWSPDMPVRANVFAITERYTIRSSRSSVNQATHGKLAAEIQYWAGVIMRNACRKDELRGGVRQCANMQCGKWETYPREFAKCRRCRKCKYCSKQCQSKGWQAGHRFWCSSRMEEAEAARQRSGPSGAPTAGTGVDADVSLEEPADEAAGGARTPPDAEATTGNDTPNDGNMPQDAEQAAVLAQAAAQLRTHGARPAQPDAQRQRTRRQAAPAPDPRQQAEELQTQRPPRLQQRVRMERPNSSEQGRFHPVAPPDSSDMPASVAAVGLGVAPRGPRPSAIPVHVAELSRPVSRASSGETSDQSDEEMERAARRLPNALGAAAARGSPLAAQRYEEEEDAQLSAHAPGRGPPRAQPRTDLAGRPLPPPAIAQHDVGAVEQDLLALGGRFTPGLGDAAEQAVFGRGDFDQMIWRGHTPGPAERDDASDAATDQEMLPPTASAPAPLRAPLARQAQRFVSLASGAGASNNAHEHVVPTAPRIASGAFGASSSGLGFATPSRSLVYAGLEQRRVPSHLVTGRAPRSASGLATAPAHAQSFLGQSRLAHGAVHMSASQTASPTGHAESPQLQQLEQPHDREERMRQEAQWQQWAQQQQQQVMPHSQATPVATPATLANEPQQAAEPELARYQYMVPGEHELLRAQLARQHADMEYEN
ncbi:hypothetical protein FA09DRAFT_24768 [Tilletiopsis washingtonensis]|uniref:MYND-type domain-containing protein n=1 Tax=Tilletiopsis washingtonensis TaxID=58919 RepID=A0A316Z939_9BASI|nr:hypothetical protein FA09DRAFT_24768 [Tilletiopsis washingtonensis]PWN98297.1 hypothetical protein FA09DRAFT_24768 [Tilletiopsis washingtonensis]